MLPGSQRVETLLRPTLPPTAQSDNIYSTSICLDVSIHQVCCALWQLITSLTSRREKVPEERNAGKWRHNYIIFPDYLSNTTENKFSYIQGGAPLSNVEAQEPVLCQVDQPESYNSANSANKHAPHCFKTLSVLDTVRCSTCTLMRDQTR